ncbi:hypothetical protein ACU4GD_14790 [Cupriavidus basilensis]
MPGAAAAGMAEAERRAARREDPADSQPGALCPWRRRVPHRHLRGQALRAAGHEVALLLGCRFAMSLKPILTGPWITRPRWMARVGSPCGVEIDRLISLGEFLLAGASPIPSTTSWVMHQHRAGVRSLRCRTSSG